MSKEELKGSQESTKLGFPLSLQDSFSSMLQTGFLSDVVFHVNEEKIAAHRLVLAQGTHKAPHHGPSTHTIP
eukprot:g76173.t1